MKFKVGDRVKLIKHTVCTIGFKIGDICTITKIDNDDNCAIKIENKDCCGYVNENSIEKAQFTKSDLKNEDIVTYRNGDRRTVKGNLLTDEKGLIVNDLDKYTKDLKGKQETDYMDIVKVERPVKYETVFERREEILDETEKEYLKAVITPFRDKVKGIIKEECKNKQYIAIDIKDDSSIDLPVFDKDTMYRGMKAGYTYTLEKLGL